MMTSKETLKWALERLAQLQGRNLDPLRLEAAVAQLGAEMSAVSALRDVCAALGLSSPMWIDPPDRARLPLICHTAEDGWGLIVDQDPSGFWEVVFAGGTRQLDAELLNGPVAQVSLRGASAADTSSFQQTLKKALRSYRSILIEAALASVFLGFIALATSLFSMQVYDRVIPTRSEQTLIILSLGLFLAVMLELGMKFARSHLMDSVLVGLDARLTRDIFQRLLSVRIDQLPGSVGSLAGQIRGYEQVRAFYTAGTLFTMVDVPMGLFFLLVIAAVGSVWVASVPLVFGAIAIAIGYGMRKRIERLAVIGAEASNLKTGLLVEAVEGAETIKAGSGGWKFLSRWISVNAHTIHNDMNLRGASESLGYMTASLQQVSYAALVVVGAWTVMQGGMTMGALIACSILSGRIMAPIMAIPGLMVQQAHSKAAAKSLEKLYELQSDHHGVKRPLVPTSLSGEFFLDGVKFAYPGSPPAIHIPRLQIKSGEKIAILGPIGAGKSTLLKLMTGMYRPQEGRLLLDGLDLFSISRQVVSRKVGYLQQDHRLFFGTLRDNLLIGLSDPGDDVIRKALLRSGLLQTVADHPKGLELPIQEGGKGLSGGQRQLVAFTRLLLCSNDIMLLDEPTANMDDEQERRCLAVLAEDLQASDKTFVVVTHKSSLLPLVDRIIVIANHQLVMDGPRDAVLARLRQTSLPTGNVTPIASKSSAAASQPSISA